MHWIALLAACIGVSLYQGVRILSQVEDLRTAIGQLGTDLGEAIARVEAKLIAAGDPDPDLTADIAAIKEASTRLDALAADPVVEPAPDGV